MITWSQTTSFKGELFNYSIDYVSGDYLLHLINLTLKGKKIKWRRNSKEHQVDTAAILMILSIESAFSFSIT